MSTVKPLPYIHLHHGDKDRPVKVETAEQDRFILTVEAAIRACKDFDERRDFQRQFASLLELLTQWIEQHRGTISECYLTLRDVGLLFLVVLNSKQFNQEVEDSLSDLDIAIAQNEGLNLIALSVLAIPQASQESIESFLSVKAENLKYAK